MKGLAVVGIFTEFQNRPWLSLVFWGKWRHRNWGGLQCSECVSMSGLHNGRDFCHIGWEILTLARCFRILSIPLTISPQNRGEDGGIFGWVFLCLMSGWMEHLLLQTACSSVERYGHSSRLLRTYWLTDLLTYFQQVDSNSRSFSFSLRNDLLKNINMS
jgi:hypothetical protein